MLPFACALGVYMFFEAHALKVRRLRLAFATLPAVFEGFTLLHISDLHLLRFGTTPRQLIQVLPTLPADVALFTGDYKRDSYTDDAPIPGWMERVVRACRVRHGAFGVLGNKDNRGMKRAFAAFGLDVLVNEHSTIERGGARLHLLGVAPVNPGREPDAAVRAVDGFPSDGFRILLAHTPDYVRLAAERGIELMLAGDTHGGQIVLPMLGPLKVKSRLGRRYCRGVIREGPTTLHISAGCGTTNVPLRLGCPPEVTLITLVRAEGGVA